MAAVYTQDPEKDLKQTITEDQPEYNKGETGITTTVAAVHRGLHPRHVQLMAIASGIGVGLFVGVGRVLRTAGPLPLLVGYIIYGLCFIWPLSLQVAELLAWLPLRGSIFELAARYIDPAWSFAMGYTYLFAGCMMICTEYSAIATVIGYWEIDVNPAVWVLMAMAVCYFLNMVAVRWYGETEFIMGSTKIILLVGLILATFITMVGGNPKKDVYGFRNWKNGDFAHPYYTDGATGYFLSVCTSIRYAVFTVAGPDIVALAAGEIQNPRVTIPRVAKMIFARVVGFYLTGVLAVGIICSSRDARLLGAIQSGDAGAAASPWVLGLLDHGISGFLPSLINFFIMLSGWSCGNAFLYATSRTLYSLAQDGKAPSFVLRCNKQGVPWVAVTIVTVISCLAFLVASNSAADVFGWFLDLTTVSLVVNFTAMSVVYIGWQRVLKAQGIPRIGKNHLKITKNPFSRRNKILAANPNHDANGGIIFPYVAPGGTWTPYLCVGLGSIISLCIGFDVFSPFSVRGFITSYFGLAWFWCMFAFWKVFKKTKFVDPKTVDIFAEGLKSQIDDECRRWESDEAREEEREQLKRMNFFVRCWWRLWN